MEAATATAVITLNQLRAMARAASWNASTDSLDTLRNRFITFQRTFMAFEPSGFKEEVESSVLLRSVQTIYMTHEADKHFDCRENTMFNGSTVELLKDGLKRLYPMMAKAHSEINELTDPKKNILPDPADWII